jgi:hypothetical protein
MALQLHQQVTLLSNIDLSIVPPDVGITGKVVSFARDKSLVLFTDGTLAWFETEHDGRLGTNAVVSDLSSWKPDYVMYLDQHCAGAKITREQALKELAAQALDQMGYTS